MKIALLCCGPSLTQFLPEYTVPGYNLVVGVNTAAWLYPVDWCVCADLHIIEGFQREDRKLPRVGFVTHRAMPVPAPCERRLMPLGLQANHGGKLRCRYLLPHGSPEDACAYSFPNALAFCQRMRPDCIDIFGFDCSPSLTDVAGVEGQHHCNRWEQELPWIKHAWSDNCHVYSALPLAVLAWLNCKAIDCSAEWHEAMGSLAHCKPPVWITQ